ncbi:MAG TPA: hypothetical protein VJ813_13080 [Vicinamibacterales bacterium]|nr:hypothetical protein [Vicinamibacterales bacterium]
MNRTAISGGALVSVLVLLVLAGNYRALEQDADASTAGSRATTSSTASTEEGNQGFLYGRVTTDDGAAYLGRLRFGRDEEAFWGDYFNGSKGDNPWATHAPAEQLAEKRRPITIFGFEIPLAGRQIDLGRPFMARFGDIARIEARGRHVRVTLKSGTVFDLNRMAANDFDDGVRVWDDRRGVVDLASWAGGIPPPSRVRIRAIDLLPTARLGAVPARLHGTVHTRQGDFSGFVQWDRQDCVGLDELDGRTANGALSLRFDTIRAIARRSGDSSLVTLLDGREIALAGTRKVGRGNRGIYVDDPRYGRVLVSWGAFERIDFSAGGSGPAYNDFARGRPLTGIVTTRGGRRLTGRLVYDLDESETTETLDAPSQGVDYTIPFGLIASITPAGQEERGARHAKVTLHDGEELQLDRAGDLGAGNAGMLIFIDGRERPEYVQWTDIEQLDFHRPPATYPPLAGVAKRQR